LSNIRKLIPAIFFTSGLLLLSPDASAQSASEEMRLGDEAAQALRPQDALTHYEKVVATDSSHFEALWKASMNAVDLGEFTRDRKLRENLYSRAERLGRRAVELKPESAAAQFHVARALGMAALSVGIRDRVRYAREVREHALAALKITPEHGGALHVMGVWNAEVKRLSGLERTLARAFLGAGFFSEASWDDAQQYLERATTVDPQRITHWLALARVYRDRRNYDKARAAYQAVLDGKSIYYGDAEYKKAAEAELAKLPRK
jgi:tetratricopeptide (TPR) repeat protein